MSPDRERPPGFADLAKQGANCRIEGKTSLVGQTRASITPRALCQLAAADGIRARAHLHTLQVLDLADHDPPCWPCACRCAARERPARWAVRARRACAQRPPAEALRKLAVRLAAPTLREADAVRLRRRHVHRSLFRLDASSKRPRAPRLRLPLISPSAWSLGGPRRRAKLPNGWDDGGGGRARGGARGARGARRADEGRAHVHGRR
eukprot:COSAG06_NODE_2533_length_6711_cov_6.195705_2_plen_207_part_00